MKIQGKPFRLLHTSDWHIGRSLYGRKRYDEFESFLSWLTETLQRRQVDALLVAGDVFDTNTPSNRSQELYYRFLCQVAASSCRHVVVTAGNHDSPSFLNAPKELLKVLNIHVVGAATGTPEDEVLVLSSQDQAPEMIVGAVPYLRDRDIRVAEPGEDSDDKERKLLEGIRSHYREVCASAQRRRRLLGVDVPIVVMGHLFTSGGETVDGDGVRELYVGSLARVSAVVFPEGIDYLALGHLHVPQKVHGSDTTRYSGSPLPIGFGEARQRKSVCLVQFGGREATVELVEVPVFQPLERLQGTWNEISARILELSATRSRAWLEVVYTGDEVIGDLRERLEAAVSGTAMEVLRVRNTRLIDQALKRIHEDENLRDLSVFDVFERCLRVNAVPEEQRAELLRTYREAIMSLEEEDAQAA